MVALSALAGEGPTSLIQAGGWFLEKAWIIPALPAISFVLILFFGKRMKYKGAEFGIVSIAVAFIFAICCVGQWIGQVNNADSYSEKQEYYDEEKRSDEAGQNKTLNEEILRTSSNEYGSTSSGGSSFLGAMTTGS